jgi:hypothetical protein
VKVGFKNSKKRHDLSWRCLTGDAAQANIEVAEQWIEVWMPVIQEYEPRNVFNGDDETSLFFQCEPVMKLR